MKLENGFEERSARIEMIPLLDIIFLLHVFFIYAMLSMTIHRAIPVELPKATTAEILTGGQVIIAVDKSGAFFVNREPVAPEALAARVAALAPEREKAKIYVSGDREAGLAAVVDCLDRLRGAGYSSMSIACEAPGGR